MRFNEAAGADPADAGTGNSVSGESLRASMRPRGQTPRMLGDSADTAAILDTLQ